MQSRSPHYSACIFLLPVALVKHHQKKTQRLLQFYEKWFKHEFGHHHVHKEAVQPHTHTYTKVLLCV